MKKNKWSLSLSLALLEKEPIILTGEFPTEFAAIENEEMFQVSSPVKFSLEARMVSGNVVVSGDVSCMISGECGRCLEPAELEVGARRFKLFYDEVEGEELDITEDVRAELLLSIPMNLVCSAECRGLCLQCGANLNKITCNCHSLDESDFKEGEDLLSPWEALDNLKL